MFIHGLINTIMACYIIQGTIQHKGHVSPNDVQQYNMTAVRSSPTCPPADQHLPFDVIENSPINRSLRTLVGGLAGTLFFGWCVGAAGLSVAWLLLLAAIVLARWSSQFTSLLKEARSQEIDKTRRRRALAGCESAEWLNTIFNRWWRCSAESIFCMLRERCEPLLNESKPPFVESVEIKQFTFGGQTPWVQNVRSYESGNPTAPALRQDLSLEVMLHLNSEEFRMILRARLFGKGVGVDVDVAIEKLYVCGKLVVTFSLDATANFPHITNVAVSFVDKPQVWFSVRMLKGVQMMEVPILKTWLHSVVLDALETALVNPGHLSFNPWAAKKDAPTSELSKNNDAMEGVLIVTLSAASDGQCDNDEKWMVLRLGEQTWRTTAICPGWSEKPCFLVSSLETDKFSLKIKCKRLVTTVTLAQYEWNLQDYKLDKTQVVETHLEKRCPREGVIPSIGLSLEYAALPPQFIDPSPPVLSSPTIYCGVVTIFVHQAHGLISSEPYQCNPYCIIFNNRRKVKNTAYLLNQVTPVWEARSHILVTDYTQVSLSFVVCSWNTKKMADDEMLGVAVLSLTQNDFWVHQRSLPLSGSSNASLVVSVMFQPVPRMSGDNMDGVLPSDSLEGGIRSKRNSSSWVQQAKCFLGRGDQEMQSGSHISNIVSSGLGLMEVTILRARELVPMDMNGFSDPFCEVKVNSECKYKSSIKKKTLNPLWEENAIMALPRTSGTLEVIVWDHDTFGMKDFLGSVTLMLNDIRSASREESAVWYPLQGVRSGQIELRIKVISEDASVNGASRNNSLGSRSVEQSPVPRRQSMERSRVRLGVHVPPPTPPRTVSIPQKPPDFLLPPEFANGGEDCDSTVSESCIPRLTITDSPSMTKASSCASSQLNISLPPSPHSDSEKKMVEPSGFRSIRLKVSRSLRLRRFKSEVNVRGSNNNGIIQQNTINVLNHAVSQPNVAKTVAVRPTELNLNCSVRPDSYSGVEGKVIQAQGLHVAHVAQLYCRIKLIGCKEKQDLGRTLAKSHLLPAMPNPQFQLHFQISNPDVVPRQAVLLFEIRSSDKEVLALRRITLQDILSGDMKETHTWLALNNGATLEVTIAHGRTLKKQSKKLFRSWSIHRMGKI